MQCMWINHFYAHYLHKLHYEKSINFIKNITIWDHLKANNCAGNFKTIIFSVNLLWLFKKIAHFLYIFKCSFEKSIFHIFQFKHIEIEFSISSPNTEKCISKGNTNICSLYNTGKVMPYIFTYSCIYSIHSIAFDSRIVQTFEHGSNLCITV